MKRILLLALSIGSIAGFVDCPGAHTPTIPCRDFSMFVPPGTCQLVKNPCDVNRDGDDDVEWAHAPFSDGFRFDESDRPASVYVDDVRKAGVTTRSICAAPGSPNIGGDSLVFVYGRGAAFGTGHVTLVVAPVLTATASANPEAVDPGAPSQLVVTVAGGIPPYSYFWQGPALSARNIPAPVATPNVTSTYEAMVTDSVGQSLGHKPGQDPFVGYVPAPAKVTVHVNSSLRVTANPPAIRFGDFSALSASIQGGTPPFTFEWSPVEGLDLPSFSNPTATPLRTTTYTVTVTDGEGVTRTGSAEVYVGPSVQPTAHPATIEAGKSSQLDANPNGGDGVFTYQWFPAAGLSNPAIRNPLASPAATTDYFVRVTDGHGVFQDGHVLVAITGAGLASSFTFLRGALDPVARTIHWTFDASSSTGAIVSYTWDLLGNDGTAVHTVSAGPVLGIDVAESAQRGTMTLTVTDENGATASLTLNYR